MVYVFTSMTSHISSKIIGLDQDWRVPMTSHISSKLIGSDQDWRGHMTSHIFPADMGFKAEHI